MNAIAKTAPAATILRPQSFADLVQFANMASKSAMVPRDYQGKPENIMLAIQMGSELGLAPMQSLQNIACVNGRPAVWGDAVVGLCRQSPVCKDIVEAVTGEGDKQVATCTATRVGAEPVVRSFSVEDAKKAGLWGKSGPWQQYPKRMLQMRARGFAVRDAFPDVLRGLITAEEAADIPVRDTFRGTTLDAEPHEHAAQVDRQLPTAPVRETSGERTESPSPKRPTQGQWLDALALELAACEGPDEVDAILARDDVQKAQDRFNNGSKDRLVDMIQVAIERTSPDETSAPNAGVFADSDSDPFREVKGPERLEPRRACNLFNSPAHDRKDGVAASPFCPIVFRRARGDACSSRQPPNAWPRAGP